LQQADRIAAACAGISRGYSSPVRLIYHATHVESKVACSRQPAAHRARQEPLELDLLTASCEHDVFVRGLSTDPLNYVDFQAPLQNCEKDYQSCRVCLSVLMEKLDSHRTDFHEILLLSILSKICRIHSSFINI
jgi:hypothetical protein